MVKIFDGTITSRIRAEVDRKIPRRTGSPFAVFDPESVDGSTSPTYDVTPFGEGVSRRCDLRIVRKFYQILYKINERATR